MMRYLSDEKSAVVLAALEDYSITPDELDLVEFAEPDNGPTTVYLDGHFTVRQRRALALALERLNEQEKTG